MSATTLRAFLRSAFLRSGCSRSALATLGFVAMLAMPALAAEGEQGGHGDDHAFNLYYGLLGEDTEAEHPTILFRTKGMPVPLGSYLINSSILFFLLYRFGKRPIVEGLKQRRKRIMQGMEEAGQMKAEAEAQLAAYQAKLDDIEREVTRIRKESREAAEAERTQILADAKKRRERMDQEAKLLVAQELKAAREQLYRETVQSALATARNLVTTQTNAADHTRLSEEYLASLGAGLVSSKGGQA